LKIEWNEDLAVGVAKIDEQHKELFNRFNHLLEACSAGSGSKEIGSLLCFLDEYVRVHFSDEEKLQVAHSYPDYPLHREQHRIFINKLDEFKKEMLTEGATLSLTIATNRMMIDWLLNHIAQMDKKIGEFINQKK
jgi:hemerythrin